jgi:hypothetical protein
MNRIFISVLMTTFLVGCTQSEKANDQDLLLFNQFIGLEKAEVLDLSVETFHEFLRTNYPKDKELRNQTFAFLTELSSFHKRDSNWRWINPKWSINEDETEELIGLWQSSGLRREVWLYGSEYRGTYDSHLDYSDTSKFDLYARKKQAMIDSLLRDNPEGGYIKGLRKYAPDNEYFKGFFDYQSVSLSTPSPVMLIPSLIEKDVELTDPFIQRIITTELFIPIIDQDLERKKRKTTRKKWR